MKTILFFLFSILIVHNGVSQAPTVVKLEDFKDEVTTGFYEDEEKFENKKMDSVPINMQSKLYFIVRPECTKNYKYGLLFTLNNTDVGRDIDRKVRVIVNNRIYPYDVGKNLDNSINWQFKYQFLFLDLLEIFRLALSSQELTFCDLVESGAKVQLQYRVPPQSQYITIEFKERGVVNNILFDPRQYVTIYERRTDEPTSTPIWWLTKQSVSTDQSASRMQRLVPVQKYKYIDMSCKLEVHFDQEALSKNINMQGSISVEARSNKKKIEILPYSVIGEERISFGVNAMPIKEIADYFLRLMIESHLYDRIWEGYDLGRRDSISDRARELTVRQVDRSKKLILKIFEKMASNEALFNSRINMGFTQTNLDDDYDLGLILENLEILSRYWEDPDLRIIVHQIKTNNELQGVYYSYKDVKDIIDKFPDGDTLVSKIKQKGEVTEVFVNDIKSRSEKARLIHELLKRIKESNEQTISAFLSLTVLTITEFNEIYRTIDENIADISNVKASTQMSRSDANLLYEKLYEIRDVVGRFISGSILFRDLLENNNYSIELNRDFDYRFLSDTMPKKDITELTADLDSYNRIRESFAQSAGLEIFKKLVFATIDLEKVGLADGDQVEIYVLWINANGSTSKKDQITELATGSFIVKKTGWHLEASESALLIHRLDEEKLRSDYPLSPSNFKPTAGASLLWSYSNSFRVPEHRRNRNKEHEHKRYPILKFLQWLEPSFGINVSYLDFQTDKDFEFGAGPVMGLFQNRVFFTAGYNFNVNGESPFYIGIGFSFSNIYKRVAKNENN